MESTTEIDPQRLVQPAAPGMTLPASLDGKGLFLLNFTPVLLANVWDYYGIKELRQAQCLRGLAARITAIADAMEQLGYELNAYPDADDFEMDDYEQTWEEICEEMQSTLVRGYFDLARLVDVLADAALDDFMD